MIDSLKSKPQQRLSAAHVADKQLSRLSVSKDLREIEGREALNLLALRGFRSAPYVQWAMISLEHSLRAAEDGNPAQVSTYLNISLRAVRFANQILRSNTLATDPQLSTAGRQVSESLQRSIRSFEDSATLAIKYLKQLEPDLLVSSRTSHSQGVGYAIQSAAALFPSD